MLPRVKNTRGTSMNTASFLITIFRLANEKINSNTQTSHTIRCAEL